jgi:hypothetical protein
MKAKLNQLLDSHPRLTHSEFLKTLLMYYRVAQ